MKVVKAFYHPDFKKAINSYPLKEKTKVIKKIGSFLADPYSPSLKTHKLAGKLNGFWSFSVSYHLRILFRFMGQDVIEFIDIGGHEIYK